MLTDGFTFLLKGGPVMYPLFLCAIVAVTIMIERSLVLAKVLKGNRNLIREVRPALEAGRDKSALERLQYVHGPVARVLETAIRNRGASRDQLEEAIEEVAVEETPSLYRGLSVLDTIITVSPLLGLLGTVTGMIKAFKIVALTTGMNAPSQITGGVAEALIATATGLAIAIVSLVAYNGLTDRVKSVVSEMEISATKVVNILDASRQGQPAGAAGNGVASGAHHWGASAQTNAPQDTGRGTTSL